MYAEYKLYHHDESNLSEKRECCSEGMTSSQDGIKATLIKYRNLGRQQVGIGIGFFCTTTSYNRQKENESGWYLDLGHFCLAIL
jgi:hypothetical protein